MTGLSASVILKRQRHSSQVVSSSYVPCGEFALPAACSLNRGTIAHGW